MDTTDQEAIQGAVQQWGSAWNAGDMGAAMALVHLRWALQGDHDLDGTPRPPRQGLFSWLMLRDAGGRWLIRSAHNTNITVAT